MQRGQEQQQTAHSFLGHSSRHSIELTTHGIAEFHQLGDGGVELQFIALQILANGFDRGVHRSAQIGFGRSEFSGQRQRRLQLQTRGFSAITQPPDALQEAELPFHIGVIPFQILFRWSLEQDEHARGVSAVAVHNGSWITPLYFDFDIFSKNTSSASPSSGSVGWLASLTALGAMYLRVLGLR